MTTFARLSRAALLVGCAFAAGAPQARAAELWSETIALSAEDIASFAPSPTDPAAFEQSLSQAVLSGANVARAQFGLGSLAEDASLSAIAAAYSRKMLDQGFFDHVSPDGSRLDTRMAAEIWRFRKSAENLWTAHGKLDWRPERISAQTVDNWLRSPGHRVNLLEPGHTLAGVGAAQRGDRVYVTMLYATPQENMDVARKRRDFAAPPSDRGGFASQLETAALSAINAVRARSGLSPLTPDPRLAGLARSSSGAIMRGAAMSVDGALLDQAGAMTGANRVAATLWSGQGGLVWTAEDLAETMMKTWSERGGLDTVLDGSYASVGLGVEVGEQGVRLAAIFADGGANRVASLR